MVGEQKLLVGLCRLLGRRRNRLRGATPRALREGCRRHREAEYRHERSELHSGELFHKNRKVSYIPCMSVHPELLEILACPNCKTPVQLVKNGAALKCQTCKRVYPIKDDIPVMLLDEATIEP
jgi:hypothetical protein